MVFLVAAACNGASQREELSAITARVSAVACNDVTVGTAVAIGDGFLLTNAHVLAGVTDPPLVLPSGVDVSAGLAATIVGFDKDRDLALLAVPEFRAEPLEFARTDTDATGVIAGMNNDVQLELTEFVVKRRVNATSGDIYDEGDVVRQAIDVQAEISPGVSGAGLFDEELRLVGLVFADSRASDSTYALDIPEIEAFLAETDRNTSAQTGRCR